MVALGVFLALFWTTAVGFWGSFSRALPTVAAAEHAHAHQTPEEEEAEHKRICHCINCPGGKLCCCQSVTSLVLRASCDLGAPLAAPITLGVALVPQECLAAQPLLFPVPPSPRASRTLRVSSRTPVPPSLPPLALS